MILWLWGLLTSQPLILTLSSVDISTFITSRFIYSGFLILSGLSRGVTMNWGISASTIMYLRYKWIYLGNTKTGRWLRKILEGLSFWRDRTLLLSSIVNTGCFSTWTSTKVINSKLMKCQKRINYHSKDILFVFASKKN